MAKRKWPFQNNFKNLVFNSQRTNDTMLNFKWSFRYICKISNFAIKKRKTTWIHRLFFDEYLISSELTHLINVIVMIYDWSNKIENKINCFFEVGLEKLPPGNFPPGKFHQSNFPLENSLPENFHPENSHLEYSHPFH